MGGFALTLQYADGGLDFETAKNRAFPKRHPFPPHPGLVSLGGFPQYFTVFSAMSCPCADCRCRRATRPRQREVDPVVSAVTRRFHQRSAEGMETYGVTMANNDASTRSWITDAQEELMDAILYLERLKSDFPDE